MKRIGIIIILICSYAGVLAEVTIRTEASFGSKKKDCLKGLGMCSAKTTTNEADGRLVVSLTLSDDESVLTLGLPGAVMDEPDGQVVGDKFIQDEDFGLPSEISRALGTTGSLVISAGSYPVQRKDGRILVKIPVTGSTTGLR